MRRRPFIAACALAPALAVRPAVPAQANAATEAGALFEAYWERVMREAPEFATFIGDRRYQDRLGDASAAGVQSRKRAFAEFRESAARIDAAALVPAERTSLRVFLHFLDSIIAIDRQYGSLPFGTFDSHAPVTQLGGPQIELPQLAKAMGFESVGDYEAWLSRLAALPTQLAQLIERMQAGLASGWLPPRASVERVPAQIDVHLVADPRSSPEYEPFKTFPPDIESRERERLSAAAAQLIEERVRPAFQRLKDFYLARYLPATGDRGGAADLPGGLAYYQTWLDFNTTTHATPRELHELGLAEVARIGARMDEVVRATGWTGSRADFQHHLRTDPHFFFERAEDMLAAYRDIAKRADAALPRLFAELPRQPYGVRAMRPEEGDNPEHYTNGAPGRPGWFEANVNVLASRPKWEMTTLLLHEAVPGHHLQISRAQELPALPSFRRFGDFSAYTEGWALYAEGLGDEMGLYADPYQKFGNLAYEMWRASRLVVDTGLHAFGWTRERAIDYLVAQAGLTRSSMTSEVDRYLVWPGQATAYKVGELEFKALRAKARAALGERFDLRRFHNALIDNGALPLSVLEEQIGEWIAAEKAPATQ
jgi:uncharacterized protein (DUF885 family)